MRLNGLKNQPRHKTYRPCVIKLLTLVTNLNVPIAHHKAFPASTELDHEFLGVLLYSQKMIASFPVTRKKQDLTVWLSKSHALYANSYH